MAAENGSWFGNLWKDITGRVATSAVFETRSALADAIKPSPGVFRIGSMTVFQWVTIAVGVTILLFLVFKR